MPLSLLGCNIVKCCVLREKTWGLSKPPVCLEQRMRTGSAELFVCLQGYCGTSVLQPVSAPHGICYKRVSVRLVDLCSPLSF